jgi:hypothetical protein
MDGPDPLDWGHVTTAVVGAEPYLSEGSIAG